MKRHLFTICVCMVAFKCVSTAQTSMQYSALVQEANGQLQAGDNEQALASANSAIRANAGRWEAYAVAGGALLNLKRYEEAADQFSHAIDHAPDAKKAGLRDLRKQCLLAESGTSANVTDHPAAPPVTQPEIVLWKTIQNSSNIEDFRTYLQQYPNGAYAALATNHLKDLREHSEALMDQALAQDKSGNYAAAVQGYGQACDAGSATACFFLSTNYAIGLHGLEKDQARAAQLEEHAVQLYQEWCDVGNSTSCFVLAGVYKSGTQFIAQNDNHAVQLYLRAAQIDEKECSAGNAPNCSNLGNMYDNGFGVTQDNARALQFYRRGCDGRDARGCSFLGYMYEHAQGVDKDEARAIQLYQEGCDGGYGYGCARLADIYNNGQDVSQDKARAKLLYTKACSLGDQASCSK